LIYHKSYKLDEINF